MENSFMFLTKLNILLLDDPAITLLDINPNEQTGVYSRHLFVIPKLEATKMSFFSKQVDKRWFLQAMDKKCQIEMHYRGMKRHRGN